jgi:hypothetical protein
MKTTDVERAYAAGLIDGEGYITINKQKTSETNTTYGLRVSVGQSTKGIILLHWLKDKFNAKLSSGYTKRKPGEENRLTLYQCFWSGPTAYTFLKWIRPFLVFKSKQARLGMQFFRMKRSRKNYRHSKEEKQKACRMYWKMRRLNRFGIRWQKQEKNKK